MFCFVYSFCVLQFALFSFSFCISHGCPHMCDKLILSLGENVAQEVLGNWCRCSSSVDWGTQGSLPGHLGNHWSLALGLL